MVSDKPPRRSKSDKSPVTIDLSAQDVKTIATPVRSNDSDIVPGAEKPAADNSTAEASSIAQKADVTAAKSTTAETEKPSPVSPAPAATAKTAETKAEPKPASPPPSTAKTAEPSKPASAASSTSASASTSAASGSASSATTPPQPQPKPADSKAGPSTSSPMGSSASKPASRPAPGVPALVAAGIFGGVVALLLAGSMQYAGYLPGGSAAGGGSSSDVAALQQQVASLNERLSPAAAELPSRVEALEKASAGANGGSSDIGERLAALEAQLAEARSSAAASTDLSQRLQAVETEINQPGREEAVAKALAASALKTAIDRGGPFTGELQTFAGIAKDDPATATLQKFAESGVPSASALVQNFRPAADAILDAANGTDPQAGVGSRLLSSAMQMVKIRQVGDVEGDTPEAIVARMEDRLRKGDLKAAAEQWNALPQDAKDASVAYKQSLDARIEVDSLVDNTLNRAIAGAGNAG